MDTVEHNNNSEERFKSLHRRFDSLENHVNKIHEEARESSTEARLRFMEMENRINTVEVTAVHAAERERMTFEWIKQELLGQTKVIDTIKNMFQSHTEKEEIDRGKLNMLLVSILLSILGTISYLMFHKIFIN